MYSEYLNHFENSNNLLTELKEENDEFLEFLEKNERTPQVFNQDITSLLVSPVLRLPKYTILLKEILKYTDEDHPDYDNIKKAIDVVFILI